MNKMNGIFTICNVKTWSQVKLSDFDIIPLTENFLPCEVDEGPYRLCVLKIRLQFGQLILPVAPPSHTRHLLQRLHMTGERQNRQVVIQEHAGMVGSQTQDESNKQVQIVDLK